MVLLPFLSDQAAASAQMNAEAAVGSRRGAMISPMTTRRRGLNLSVRVLVTGALLCVAGALPLAAQGPPGQGLAAVKQEDLTMGVVVAGTSIEVTHLDASAAKFQVTGPRNRDVALTFVLPVALSSGGFLLPVEFGPSSAAWASADQTTGRTTFNPALGTVVRIPATGTIYIWVGAAVGPPQPQPGGAYTGTMQLVVTLL